MLRTILQCSGIVRKSIWRADREVPGVRQSDADECASRKLGNCYGPNAAQQTHSTKPAHANECPTRDTEQNRTVDDWCY